MQKNHATELSFFCGEMPDDATESVATHSTRLQPSIISCPSYSLDAMVPKFTTLKSGMEAQVSLETTIKPLDLLYYLGLEPALHGRKAKVLAARPPLSLVAVASGGPGPGTVKSGLSLDVFFKFFNIGIYYKFLAYIF